MAVSKDDWPFSPSSHDMRHFVTLGDVSLVPLVRGRVTLIESKRKCAPQLCPLYETRDEAQRKYCRHILIRLRILQRTESSLSCNQDSCN